MNPIAGLGGAVGLHGTDGAAALEAVNRGATPIAHLRAARAIRALLEHFGEIEVWAVGGGMGAELIAHGGTSLRLALEPNLPTRAEDTRQAAKIMANAGVDLIMFAGGDGTASDVAAVVGLDVPIIGVPTGVKMHSGTFGVTPEAAGEVAARYLADPASIELATVDVLDVRGDRSDAPTRLAAACVPTHRDRLQKGKVSRVGTDEADLEALSRQIAREMVPGRLYVLGPGATTARIAEAIDVEPTMSGVDVIRDRRIVIKDATERDLLAAIPPDGGATLVLSVIGGQGFLLGRGNQQISPQVIKRVGQSEIVVIASREKLAMLQPARLYVDLDTESPESLVGPFIKVWTGPGRAMMMRVSR